MQRVHYWIEQVFSYKILFSCIVTASAFCVISPETYNEPASCTCKIISSKESWSIVVDQKAPFSIATTPMCRGGPYSFPWIAPLTLDPYFLMPSVKQRDKKYHFCFLYDSTRNWTPVSRTIDEYSNYYHIYQPFRSGRIWHKLNF